MWSQNNSGKELKKYQNSRIQETSQKNNPYNSSNIKSKVTEIQEMKKRKKKKEIQENVK